MSETETEPREPEEELTGSSPAAARTRKEPSAPVDYIGVEGEALAAEAAAEAAGEAAAEAEAPKAPDVLHFDPTAPAKERTSIDQEPGRIVPIIDFCINYHGAPCDRCLRACPAHALTFRDNGLPCLDEKACTSCGICMGICDSFVSSKVTIRDLRSRIRMITAATNTLVLTCDENVFADLDPAENVLILPCLAALSPELLTAVLAEGTKIVVACDLGYCEDCDKAAHIGPLLYEHAFKKAEAWSGKSIEFTDEIPERKNLARRLVVEGSDRRELFTSITSSAADIASGNRRLRTDPVIAEFKARQERMRAATQLHMGTIMLPPNRYNGTMVQKRMSPRRSFILEAIENDPSVAPRVEVNLSDTDKDRCTACLECIKVCPTHARCADNEGYLLFDARYCIGCGLYEKACTAGACEVFSCTGEDLVDEVRASAVPKPPPQIPGTSKPKLSEALDGSLAEDDS